jgi:isoleucyl-tRNA synthetase
MTDAARDYSETLFLPKTDFPMRAGLPQKEPEILARWQRIGLYERLRAAALGRAKFVLHDGPPYANGNIHIGHALNKILKDVVTRSQQMLGYDSNYVPGWDCHGLPIEWKIEEEYRAQGRNKDAVPIVEFRRECRAFAEHWIDVQREEFKRLGVIGDWEHPYTTIDFAAEAQIARELMKFARNGTLYRGSKPVMWSVVEKTALAEAEVEYEDFVSDQVWVKFPVGKVPSGADGLRGAALVIWTTTPWTIPGNRAISYSPRIGYGLYEITDAPKDNWAKVGERLILADRLAADVMKQARVSAYRRLSALPDSVLLALECTHPLAAFHRGYGFRVPLLKGDHVTDDVGTGFVHTAPGHGRDDFEIWIANARRLDGEKINAVIPYTVDEDGRFTDQAPGFTGRRVITELGEKGDANEAVIKALANARMLIARGRLKHQYPHSWRSKKPVIFRNTPQWFIAMDRPIADADGNARPGDTLRARALAAIEATRWVPVQGENRINGMIESRPDWVISRQRAWGVPITVFVREQDDGSVEILDDQGVDQRIAEAFEREGADAWYADGAAARLLGNDHDSEEWHKVDDICDVWFDSGATHSYTLETRDDLKVRRQRDGGPDTVMYLEGSDQHRGWFQSSLLESCGTRTVAPFDVVLTHGFVLDEHGRKMSKSLGNVTAPQDVIEQSGADILRLWCCASDYADDLRIGPEILKTTVDTYRKLRNTIRWMLGSLAHYRDEDRIAPARMPELERLMLHRLVELDRLVRQCYAEFDYKRIFAALNAFMTSDLSAFYFDVRKDALYCDPASSPTRKACLTVLDHLFRATVCWLAPMLPFTAEEAWLARYPSTDSSVHLELFPALPDAWHDQALAEKWRKVRLVRRVVTGALEIEREGKRIGSSLEAAPVVYVSDRDLFAAMLDVDLAEVAITSAATLVEGEGPPAAFRIDEVGGVAVEVRRASGTKCARSWKILPGVGSDPAYPDVSPRDAQALREWEAMRKAAE